MRACACEAPLLCDADTLELETSWLDTPLDVGALCETSCGCVCLCAGSFAEAEDVPVLGTGLDICFCVRCVAGAYEDNGDAHGAQCEAAWSRERGTAHEQAAVGGAGVCLGVCVLTGVPHAYKRAVC